MPTIKGLNETTIEVTAGHTIDRTIHGARRHNRMWIALGGQHTPVGYSVLRQPHYFVDYASDRWPACVTCGARLRLAHGIVDDYGTQTYSEWSCDACDAAWYAKQRAARALLFHATPDGGEDDMAPFEEPPHPDDEPFIHYDADGHVMRRGQGAAQDE